MTEHYCDAVNRADFEAQIAACDEAFMALESCDDTTVQHVLRHSAAPLTDNSRTFKSTWRRHSLAASAGSSNCRISRNCHHHRIKRSKSLLGRSKNARTTRSPRNSDKPQVAALVPDWAAPACVPELFALAGKAQLRKAIRSTRGTSPPSGLDPGVGVSAGLSHKESDAW
jgi:hypothetical protein